MGMPSDAGAQVLAPVGGGTAPNAAQTLANTGVTESHNATVLNTYCFATLRVGAFPIRVSFRAATGGATQVATTDPLYQAGEVYHWWVTPDTRVVYVEAGDGLSAYECWVWNSSP